MNKRILWKQIKRRGPILWENIDSQSLLAGEFPATYYYRSYPDGKVNYYESLSALQPCGDKRHPHKFRFLSFNEYGGFYDDWELIGVQNPLRWQTEKEFLDENCSN